MPRSHSKTKSKPWSLRSLEPRLMLAGDAGAAVQTAIVAPAAHLDIRESTETVVFIDSAVDDFQQVMSSVSSDAQVVLLDGNDGVEQITQHLNGVRDVREIHIITHGRQGAIQFGDRLLSSENVNQHAEQLRQWRGALTSDADILIYGCDTAAGSQGADLLGALALLTGADIAGSVDRTGNAAEGGDWDLEFSTGEIQAPLAIATHRLASYQHHLGIQIRAGGTTSDELMELEVDGEIVATWFVRNTDANNGQLLDYFYNVDGIDPSSIRINYVNDLYDPANGVDRNLRVDFVSVDGVTYQTEDPSVFSTGTWLPQDGIQPGNRQSEYLHANGYFQFAGDNNSGSGNLNIFARGQTGEEQFDLLIDGQVVQSFGNVPTGGAVYSYSFSGNLNPESVRIAFTNDAYDPGAGVDRNLIVDAIEINGARFETEAPEVFSTGSWDGQGITPGFKQLETLHANGYFQYGGDGDPGGGEVTGDFVLASDVVSAVESDGSVLITINRVGGSDGTATVNYVTADDTAQAGSDYVGRSGSVVFADGQTSRNVRITLTDDGNGEGTESFSFRLTSSTGGDLLAPRTTTVNILDDDSNLPAFSSFNSSTNLQLNGNANVNNGRLQLTAATAQQRGSTYYTTPIAFDANTSFQASFSAQFTGGQGSNGGEGLALVFQNSPAGVFAQNIGNFSGGLDYNGVPNSIAVELDTFQNSYEQFGDEITIVQNGTPVTPLRTIQSPYDLNNGQEYFVWVDYNGTSDVLAVYISDTSDKPDFATVKTNVQLNQVLGNQAYVGFAAATGNNFNNTFINSWNVTLDAPVADPPTFPTGNIFENSIVTGLNQPLAVDWSPDGRNLYIAEKGGVLKVVRDGGAVQTVIDISDRVNDFQDRGLLDFALHPDFNNTPYLYLLYTVDPPQVFDNIGNDFAGPDGRGNRAGQLIRLTLDSSTNYTSVVGGSEVTVLGSNSTWNNFNAFTDSTLNFSEPPAGGTTGNYLQDFINSDSRSHTVGSLAFGLDGALFVSIGDGASFNQTDVRALRVQDVDSLSGKVLRIDPLTGQGLSDNPFYNGDPNANRSKVYQLGLRNPWRLTVDEVSGALYIGETGLSNFEEINTGGPGANFGWPFYEGGQGINRRTPTYQNLPQSQAFYASGGNATPAFIALAHGSGSDAVALGDVTYGLRYGPQYNGDIFYNDFARGIVRHADVGADGTLLGASVFTTGAEFVVDIQQGPDGWLYYADLLGGTVGRWEAV